MPASFQGDTTSAPFYASSTPAVFSVNSAADTTNSGGVLTLRDAILVENGTLDRNSLSIAEQAQISGTLHGNGGDTILLTALAGQTIHLTTFDDSTFGPAAFLINSQVTIVGDPVLRTTIMRDGGAGIAKFRLFTVYQTEGQTGNLTLQNVTLSGGVAQGFDGGGFVSEGGGGGAAGLGGAIFNQSTLSLQATTLSANQAIGGKGGDGVTNGTGGGGGGLSGAGATGDGGGGFGANGGGAGSLLNGGSGSFGGGGGGGGYEGVSGYGVGGAGGFGGGGGGGGGDSGGSAVGGNSVFGGGAGGNGGGNGGGSGGGGGAGLGGAIFNDANGIVTISSSTLTGNSAQGGLGGTALGTGSSGSGGQGLGGAVFNNTGGAVTISTTTLTTNNAQGAPGVRGSGGAVYNAGSFTVNSSAFISNTVVGLNNDLGGGAICTTGASSNLTATNSTFANNRTFPKNTTALGGGGAIEAYYGSTILLNSTLTGNSAQNGGGIDNFGLPSHATVTLGNTIIAGNSASAGPDFLHDFISQGHNLIQDTSGTSGLTGSDLNQDPLLGPLGHYGGPTQTIPLLAGSPALRTGDTPLVVHPPFPTPFTDQRGLPRIVNSHTDIGAFENQLVATGVGLTPTFGRPLRDVLVATFTDGNPLASLADFPLSNITIDWGDGSTSTKATGITQTGGPGTAFQVFGTHTYNTRGIAASEGVNIRVTIADVNGNTAQTTSLISSIGKFTPSLFVSDNGSGGYTVQVAGFDSQPAASLEDVSPSLFMTSKALDGSFNIIASFPGSTDYTSAAYTEKITTDIASSSSAEFAPGKNGAIATIDGAASVGVIQPDAQGAPLIVNLVHFKPQTTLASDGTVTQSNTPPIITAGGNQFTETNSYDLHLIGARPGVVLIARLAFGNGAHPTLYYSPPHLPVVFLRVDDSRFSVVDGAFQITFTDSRFPAPSIYDLTGTVFTIVDSIPLGPIVISGISQIQAPTQNAAIGHDVLGALLGSNDNDDSPGALVGSVAPTLTGPFSGGTDQDGLDAEARARQSRELQRMVDAVMREIRQMFGTHLQLFTEGLIVSLLTAPAHPPAAADAPDLPPEILLPEKEAVVYDRFERELKLFPANEARTDSTPREDFIFSSRSLPQTWSALINQELLSCVALTAMPLMGLRKACTPTARDRGPRLNVTTK